MGTNATLEALKERHQTTRRPRVYATAERKRSLGDLFMLVALRYNGPFAFEDLAVACWQTFPDQFAMRGHPHPDTHRLAWLLSSTRGPVKRGFLKLLGGRFYEVTALGRRQYAAEVGEGD